MRCSVCQRPVAVNLTCSDCSRRILVADKLIAVMCACGGKLERVRDGSIKKKRLIEVWKCQECGHLFIVLTNGGE